MGIASRYGPLVAQDRLIDSPVCPVTVAIWRRYWSEGDLASRNELIVTYEPLVRKTVARLPVNIRVLADSDDLYSFGVFGLIDAIGKCNASRDLSRFPAYACYRIRGTIVDELRRLDWVPRSIRRQLTAYRNSVDDLSNELGRMPQHSEVIASLSLVNKSGYSKLLNAVLAQSNERPISRDDVKWADTVAAASVPALLELGDPADYVVVSEQHEMLHEAIDQLTERQRLVVKLRFGAGQTQQQIAKTLGVTTPRICQIEASAIQSLRRILRESPDTRLALKHSA